VEDESMNIPIEGHGAGDGAGQPRTLKEDIAEGIALVVRSRQVVGTYRQLVNGALLAMGVALVIAIAAIQATLQQLDAPLAFAMVALAIGIPWLLQAFLFASVEYAPPTPETSDAVAFAIAPNVRPWVTGLMEIIGTLAVLGAGVAFIWHIDAAAGVLTLLAGLAAYSAVPVATLVLGLLEKQQRSRAHA
jgi:hypothetical protein